MIEFPYLEPLKTAEAVSTAELRTLIAKLKEALKDSSDPNCEWYDRYCISLKCYLQGDMDAARWWSNHAELVRPADYDNRNARKTAKKKS